MRARPRRRQPGFTLLELLVVVTIIAILATLVAVAVGALGEDSELDQETERFARVMALAQEQSQLEGRDFGIVLEPLAYEVRAFDGLRGLWAEIPGDPWFERHELPKGLALTLELEGRLVELERGKEPETILPQVIAGGSGDVTPYRLSLLRPDAERRIALTGAADGSIEVARDEDR